MEELLSILHDIHEDVDFLAEEALIDDGILDSFDIVLLVGRINEVFDVTVPASEIVPENFNSATALHEMIQRLEEE